MTAQTQKTCFVIIGFGLKTDYSKGVEFNLDKTYDYIVRPVFEEFGFLCFRASDIKHSGVIDIPMYEAILKADFVLADLSTLNPNVLYELGIRHAVRKNTTIIISEKELEYPFDLSHILIEKYEHLGKGIDHGEVVRFQNVLKEKINKLLEFPAIDSPLYAFFPQLELPKFTEKEIEDIKDNIDEDGSLADYILQAENAKENKDFLGAISILSKAEQLKQDNQLVLQRLVLNTYKSEHPTKIDALYAAEKLLQKLQPHSTVDLETLGLMGAVYKRLFEELQSQEYLDKSIWAYERGFYIGSSYYNGINLAFMFNVAALKSNDKFIAIALYSNSIRIRDKVKNICLEIIGGKGWEIRDDKGWVYLTLAECYFAIDDISSESRMIDIAKEYISGQFAIESYLAQREKLGSLILEFNKIYPF